MAERAPDAGPTQLTYSFAREHGLAVTGVTDAGAAALIAREGGDPRALLEARRALGRPIAVETVDPRAFEARLSELFASDGLAGDDLTGGLEAGDGLDSLLEAMPQTADLLDSDDDAPVIKLINGLIAEAVKAKASDVHVEPYEDRLAIRFRVDGVLREVLSQEARLAPLLVSRIKVMARLDIAEKRVPQDGRISLSLGRRAIDVRVSTLPSRYGERVVMRLLDQDSARLSLDDLGMDAATDASFRDHLNRPNGIILVTGPTGSGKTTTLYAGLQLLNEGSRNILTVEDPIEYGLDGVGQTQVNAKVGMTFAAGLRAILRQDPDVVMVGEIRDVETAQIATQAALTGHLVLSAVHTNSAVAAVTRLRDMGVEPFLIASTVIGVLAQRLVRRVCPHCAEDYEPTPSERVLIGAPKDGPLTFKRAKGCSACNGLGYEGRVGIYEWLVVDDAVRHMIHTDASEQEIAAYAFRSRDTLLKSGLAHVIAGRTTVEEVLRVSRQDESAHGGV